MSFKSQERNMRRLAELLSHDLSYLSGARETGPNGDKQTFLNLGKTFLRALGKDLGLRDVKVTSNPCGIAVSGDCSLYGMWENGGIYICLSQFISCSEHVILYRSIRNLHDHKGGHNRYFCLKDLETKRYEWLLSALEALRPEDDYGVAA